MILAPLIGGLLGTLAMTLFLLLPRWLNRGKVDVIRAVGALFTGKTENAYGLGLVIHFVSGVFFAYAYYFLIQLAGFPLTWIMFLLAGAIHGVIAMLLVGIVIVEHHSIARYHDRGPMTGVIQIIAHMIFGAVTGLVVQAFQAAA